MLLTALAVTPSVFAVKGKTFYHYIAYEAAFWEKQLPVSAENYPKLYLDRLATLPIDGVVFTPVFGFGSIAGILPSASYPKHQPQAGSEWMRNWKNGMPDMVKQGADPIALSVQWCRKYKKEAICALPINLAGPPHGHAPTPKRPLNSWYSYLYSEFCQQNSDALMGVGDKGRPPYASYGECVDYTNPKVRAKFVANATDILKKYDLDAILIDFTMWPCLYKTVAAGGVASAKELALTTEMMTQVKAACGAAKGRLGHPVDLLIRVPDSIGYCKDIGIDLQAWIDTKLPDGIFLGGAVQLNRWNVVGDVAAKAGIPWYASFCLSGIYVGNDSGYTGDDERLPRQGAETYRARIADAVLCNGSGCMYSQGVHFQHQIPLNQIVPYDPTLNRLGAKRYFVSYTNDGVADDWLKSGRKYRGVPSLLSGSPFDLVKGMAKYSISVWDKLDELKSQGQNPEATLITEIMIPSGVETIVTFNGKELKSFKKRSGTQLYHLPLNLVKFGPNEVTVKSKGKNRRGTTAKLGNIAVEVTFPKKEAGK